ncbi:hypothetical protein SAMN06264364_105153 [Quadrisphaera granulorum]|uniref:Antibiotic biosynthesis monooxygenase n=1 Tax=Quadrisphaera granulorum TaxID=317664 RepID=A0A316ADI9_9ACTN|nr:hypothetical protein [Quadrisphaera granulorum]PWJ54944.1 hypothetical protein BXY45_105153 [Quadrisphaera granulorum]SZE95890.1 hypothetical protein SAMN06264364_105153 [Quadrisphaera granulorum]
MTYFAFTLDVPAPIAVYDAMHTELLGRTAGAVEGLVVHLCHETSTGFEVTEVWSDRDAWERANSEFVAPAHARQDDGGAVPTLPVPEEFTVHGLVLPGSGLAV